MLSDKLVDALNKQIVMEAHASFLYLGMASWCDQQSLEGCAEFMFRQSAEEHEHMMKIFNYLLEMDATAEAPSVKKTSTSYKNVQNMFKAVYQHEQNVTKAIHNLVDLAIKENDHTTTIFLQWYVEEQKEEESLMRSILDKIKLIGDGPQSLYYIDKEIAAINQQALKADAEED